MTVQECYDKMGGDYNDVIGRLRTDERVAKFLTRVISDPSFVLLESAFANGNAEEAFRAAHTIKGVCGNLSLTKMAKSASALTEALRGAAEIPPEAASLIAQLRQDFALCAASINELSV